MTKKPAGGARKLKAKPRAKSKAKAKLRTKRASRKASGGTPKPAAPTRKLDTRPKPSTPRRPAAQLLGLVASAPTGIAQITQIAAGSAIAGYPWQQRGVAPAGYIQGMALVYARVYCKFKTGDAAALAMAKQNSGNPATDVLAWYAPEFAAAGLQNGSDGVDTLRHVFTLLIGLGMRESSGQYCCGRDQSASNVTADTAEAGAFQASYNASAASPLMRTLFTQYSANPSGFVDTFKQGVTCSAKNWQNWGTGPGAAYQQLCKTCPAFAAEFAGVGVRVLRQHWGTINNKAVEIRRDADAMLLAVQNAVDATPTLCGAVQ